MSTPETTRSELPDYIASATPNPWANRAAWFKNTAPTYAGIFLWFVFWQQAALSGTPGGSLSAGLMPALLGLVLAAAICHFLFYLAPGLLGMKTGLPLYIGGTSTFGATGGFVLPGFLMGLLQFGWLGVNTYFSSLLIAGVLGVPAQPIMIAWGIGAALLGLLGIQYVAKVATFLPLIPLITLLVLLAKTASGIGNFNPVELIAAGQSAGLPDPEVPVAASLDAMGVIFYMVTYIVGFFATAGAAGVDFGMNNRDKKDVQMGGLIGIALAIVFTAGLALLIVAGTYGDKDMAARALNETKGSLNPVELMPVILGADASKWVSLLLAISAFPSACFSSFIAANSFKTTLPKVNPFISVGVGAAISVGLALSGYAGDAAGVFGIIGASFGPICGAMTMDYLLNGNRWSGPRSGFNPAGWLAWALGLVVGLAPVLHKLTPAIPDVPMAPVAAYIVGALVYVICFKAGLRSRVLPMPRRIDDGAAITTTA